jgi:hypothetical protein
VNKQTFLETLIEGRREWQALLDEVGEQRLLQPGVTGHWSVKDIIAHIAVWERWGAALTRAATARRPATFVEQFTTELTPELDAMPFDEFNEWMVAQSHNQPVKAVIDDEQQIYEELVASVTEMSEDDLTDPERQFPGMEWKGSRPMWDLLANQSYSHYRLHAADIRSWLSNQS